jgi:hypothetical protein
MLTFWENIISYLLRMIRILITPLVSLNSSSCYILNVISLYILLILNCVMGLWMMRSHSSNIYLCNYQEGGGGFLHIFIPVPSYDMYFQRHMSWSLFLYFSLFNELCDRIIHKPITQFKINKLYN